MHELVPGVLTALWLGIWTSISPCPMATNIAAISFIDRHVGKTKVVFLTGLLYTFGRMLAYAVLGIVIVRGLLSAIEVSHLLQNYMNKLLGPILILTGMILVGLISFNIPGMGVSEKMQKKVESMGIWGALFLGIIFALSFCPVSAALFFGSLIPLSVKCGSGFLLPAFYGFGTGLPVFIFAVLLGLGAKSIGKVFDRLKQIESWMRCVTGIIFILTGIYYCLAHIFGVF
ncbi:MAG: aromatic aminobenezylarsenical efflux permease ArsG family transporter [Phycisphaerales bacterium]